MNPTVAIIGSHPRTRAEFDFSRTDADVWLFNEAISNPENRTWAKRADMIFQMHVPAIWRNPTNRNDPHHYEWLKTQNECDVMMQDEYEDVPRSKRYPLTDIAGMLGVTVQQLIEGADTEHFLSSSPAQAVALALLMGYRRIELYGIAMETNTEYQFQREGVAFWMGFAKGRGVTFYFADPTFRDAPLYGYSGKVTVEYEKFGERVEELQLHLPEATAQHQAAILETKEAVRQFVADGSKDRENALQGCVERAFKITSQVGALRGAIQENERYMKKADAMREAAAGEFVFSRQEFESAASGYPKKAKEEETKYISYGTLMGSIANDIRSAPLGSKKRLNKGQEFWDTFGHYLRAVEMMNALQGAAHENQVYMAYLDKYIRAAGGEKSEAVLLESMAQGVPAL
jgi:hypothetical protein